MTDPTTPNHDQPVDGLARESDTGPTPATSAGADDSETGNGAAAKANDVLESLRDAIETSPSGRARRPPVLGQGRRSGRRSRPTRPARWPTRPARRPPMPAASSPRSRATWAAEARVRLRHGSRRTARRPPTTSTDAAGDARATRRRGRRCRNDAATPPSRRRTRAAPTVRRERRRRQARPRRSGGALHILRRHDRPTHRHARRPAAAPEGQAGRQLRQVPARAARRPRPHDARRAGRRPGRAAARARRSRRASSRSRTRSTSS